MKPDYILGKSRWRILKVIAEEPSSPIQIAEKVGTTVSYVSQQLRLLEAAGFVKKERTGAVDKGKPRTKFSISEEIVYLISLAKGFTGKKLLHLDEHHKTILKIWLIDNPDLHYYLEKFFFEIEDHLDKIDGIFVDLSGISPKIVIVSEANISSKIGKIIKKLGEKIEFEIVEREDIPGLDSEDVFPIYGNLLSQEKVKGGLEKTKNDTR